METAVRDRTIRDGGYQCLVFFDGDGVAFANFHTGFTAEAFFVVSRVGLAVSHFVHFNGSDVHAFAATHALFRVNRNIPRHCDFLQVFWTNLGS